MDPQKIKIKTTDIRDGQLFILVSFKTIRLYSFTVNQMQKMNSMPFGNARHSHQFGIQSQSYGFTMIRMHKPCQNSSNSLMKKEKTSICLPCSFGQYGTDRISSEPIMEIFQSAKCPQLLSKHSPSITKQTRLQCSNPQFALALG